MRPRRDRALRAKTLGSLGSDWRAVAPVEGDAELIFGPPRHSASPVCMPISETQFETIWNVVRVHELDAGATIREVDNGARNRRAICEDFGVLQKPGAPDGSALVHGLICWWVGVRSDARSIVHSVNKGQSVTSAQIDAIEKR
jgi:hypothetical protein